jgi:hypothetical protein
MGDAPERAEPGRGARRESRACPAIFAFCTLPFAFLINSAVALRRFAPGPELDREREKAKGKVQKAKVVAPTPRRSVVSL